MEDTPPTEPAPPTKRPRGRPRIPDELKKSLKKKALSSLPQRQITPLQTEDMPPIESLNILQLASRIKYVIRHRKYVIDKLVWTLRLFEFPENEIEELRKRLDDKLSRYPPSYVSPSLYLRTYLSPPQ